MSRLIDADKLLEEAKELHVDDYMLIQAMASRQPTAYDVEKVVAELEEWTFEADVTMPFDKTIMKNQKLIASGNAIDIVRKGGY